MRIIGVYKISSKSILFHCYIGSSINVDHRWEEHLNCLKGNRHSNKLLQNHFNKYGENDLEFSILCNCSESELKIKEQQFIDQCNPLFNNQKARVLVKCKTVKRFNAKHIIILHSTPKIAYRDLKLFCYLNGLCYNTWAREKLPTIFNEMLLERVKTNLCKFIIYEDKMVLVQERKRMNEIYDPRFTGEILKIITD